MLEFFLIVRVVLIVRVGGNVSKVGRRVFVRSPFNYDCRAAALAVAVGPGDQPSRAVQSSREDSDINVIVKRFLRSGVLPVVNRGPALSGDVSSMEYREALDLVRASQAEFDSLPAVVRKHFGNDPAQLVAACQDPGRVEELQRLGLVEKPRTPAAVPPVVPPEGGSGA